MSVSNDTKLRLLAKLMAGEVVVALFGIILGIYLVPKGTTLYFSIIWFGLSILRWFKFDTGRVSEAKKENILNPTYIKKWRWVPITSAGVCFLLVGLGIPASDEFTFIIPGLMYVCLEVESRVLLRYYRSINHHTQTPTQGSAQASSQTFEPASHVCPKCYTPFTGQYKFCMNCGAMLI